MFETQSWVHDHAHALLPAKNVANEAAAVAAAVAAEEETPVDASQGPRAGGTSAGLGSSSLMTAGTTSSATFRASRTGTC